MVRCEVSESRCGVGVGRERIFPYYIFVVVKMVRGFFISRWVIRGILIG